MNRKNSLVLLLISLPGILSAQEPQGGTLIQMSSLGIMTLTLAFLSMRTGSGTRIAKFFGISKGASLKK